MNRKVKRFFKRHLKYIQWSIIEMWTVPRHMRHYIQYSRFFAYKLAERFTWK